jgi:hypothetical protein
LNRQALVQARGEKAMSKGPTIALGLSLAAIITTAGVPAAAGPLPASLANVKASAPTEVAQARWGGWHGGWHGGWRGGGWGWHRGWGFPGAFVGGLALGAVAAGAPYYGYNSYYEPGYPYCDPYTYCGGYGYGSYGYYGGGPYYGGYRAAYWGGGPAWGYRQWGW